MRERFTRVGRAPSDGCGGRWDGRGRRSVAARTVAALDIQSTGTEIDDQKWAGAQRLQYGDVRSHVVAPGERYGSRQPWIFAVQFVSPESQEP